MGLMTGR